MTDLRKAAENAIKVLEDKRLRMDEHLIPIVVDDLRQALAQPEQEPVHFLANGVRYKVTHQGYYGCSIVGLPENLNGQWVALVEATDSKHLNCIAHQESTKPEQQPVAYLCENAVGYKYFRWKKPTSHYKPIPLYTEPTKREWVSLDEVEIIGATCECVDDGTFDMRCALDFARSISDMLKERNT